MKSLQQVVRVGLAVVLMCGTAAAQTFTGGVRGAVRDANGVIPGVAVTLINEATAIVRETITNDVGRVQLSGGAARHLHAQGRADRLQDLREHGRPHRDPAVPDARPRARGRHAAGDGHGHRRSAAHRDLERLDRRHARPRSARDAAGARPQRLPDRRHGADGHDRRRPAVQPAAGSEQRLAGLARRRRHPGQQLPARRRADHRADRPRRAQPDDRGDRRSQGPGPHLRRRDGPHRRRRVQRDGASRGPTSSTARASTRPARCGASTRTSSSRRPASRRRRAGWPTPTTASTAAASAGRSVRNRTFFWGATEGYRSNTTRNEQQIWPSLRQRAGDFSTSTVGGVPVQHLQPVLPRRRRQRQVPGHRHRLAGDRRRVHRRHHPAHPSGRQRRSASACSTPGRPRRIGGADRRQREQPAQRRRDRPHRRRGRHVHDQGRAQVHRHAGR